MEEHIVQWAGYQAAKPEWTKHFTKWVEQLTPEEDQRLVTLAADWFRYYL